MRINVFFDGEIEPDDRMRVLRHVEECKRCSAIFDGEKELRAAFKEKMLQPAPAGLRNRVIRCIDIEKAEEAALEARDTDAPFQPCHHDISRSGFDLRFHLIGNHPTRGPINCWTVTREGAAASAKFPEGLVESLNGGVRENGVTVFDLKDRTAVFCRQCGRGKCLYLVDDRAMAKELMVILKD
jgi:anti-sigma factor (TIGR02949 family)